MNVWRRRSGRWVAMALCLVLLASACTSGGAQPRKVADELIITGDDQAELLESSPGGKALLQAIEKSTGVTVAVKRVSIADAAKKVMARADDDPELAVTWYSSNALLDAVPGAKARIERRVPTTQTPVAIAVRPAAAAKLGWSASAPPTLDAVRAAVGDGKLTFAVAGPTSDAGLAAAEAMLHSDAVRAAAAAPHGEAALKSELVRLSQSMGLLGETASGTSAAFIRNTSIDMIVGYESDLLAMTAAKQPATATVLVPSGPAIVDAFPMTLMKQAPDVISQRYEKVTRWLTSPDGQATLARTLHRRPLAAQPLPPEFATRSVTAAASRVNPRLLAELATAEMEDELRPPTVTAYVIDTSATSYGDQLYTTQLALAEAVACPTLMAGCPRENDRVILIPFNHKPLPALTVDGTPTGRNQISQWLRLLRSVGGSAPFDALDAAHRAVATELARDPRARGSVVIMTDGIANRGMSGADFLKKRASEASWKKISTYPILWGHSADPAFGDIAQMSGGEVKSFRNMDLAPVLTALRRSS